MSAKFSTSVNSSIIKKQIMGVTGLLLCGFLAAHLAGNFLLMVGSDAFNTYAYTLTHNKNVLYAAEAGLLILFLTHILMAVRLIIENHAARPERYVMRQRSGRGATFASATMPYTGLIVLVFLVLHLLHFRFGPVIMTTVDGIEMRDVYAIVMEYFKSPINVAWYLFAICALGVHVSHGFWSAFQSLGVNHPRYTPCLKIAAKIFAVVITVGFNSIAVFCYLQGR